MSHATPRSQPPSQTTMSGFSTGSGVAIIIGALLTGGLISLYSESIGWPFLTLFAIASIVVATFVNPKGLFLTVASIPLLYAFFILLTGILLAYVQLPPGQESLNRTSLVVILYPLVQFFPALLMVTLGSLIIAALRYRLLKKHNEEIRRYEARQRKKISESNQRTRREAARSRQRSQSESRVTVEELMSRRATPSAGASSTTSRTRRPADRLANSTRYSPAERGERSERTGSSGRPERAQRTERTVSRRLTDDLYER